MTSHNKHWVHTAFNFLSAVLLLLLFLRIADEVIREKDFLLDSSMDHWMNGIAGPGLTTAMQIVTFFGSFYFLVPASLLVGGWLYFSANRPAAGYFISASAIGCLLLYAAKYFFHRARPDVFLVHPEKGFSFPSGHTMSSVIFFGWLAYLLIRRFSLRLRGRCLLWLLAAIMCIAIGFSRVYLEVHYATDVLAGYCLGTCYFLTSFLLGKRFMEKVFSA